MNFVSHNWNCIIEEAHEVVTTEGYRNTLLCKILHLCHVEVGSVPFACVIMILLRSWTVVLCALRRGGSGVRGSHQICDSLV